MNCKYVKYLAKYFSNYVLGTLNFLHGGTSVINYVVQQYTTVCNKMNAWLFLVRWRSSAITASEAREMCAKIRNYGGPIINGSLNLENICAPEIIQGLK